MAASMEQQEFALKVKGWLASSLATERAAINQQMLQLHETLLAKLAAEFQNNVAAVPTIESNGVPDEFESKVKAVDPLSNIENGEDAALQMAVASEAADSDVNSPWHMSVASKTSKTSMSTVLVDSDVRWGQRDFFTRLVKQPWFEAMCIGLILLNTVFMALSSQYVGFEIGHLLKYPRMDYSAAVIWPSANRVLELAEYAFAIWYTVELCLKFLGFQLNFFKSCWNVLDLVLVVFWYVNELSDVLGAFNSTILRLARLCRLMRLVKHMGSLPEGFDSLHMLMTALVASFPVLIWATLILSALLLAAALTTNTLLQGFLNNGEYTDKQRQAVYVYFGSFTRSFISMFEMAFASHAPITRTVMENVSESWAAYFCVYKCVISLCVMRVIAGVFMHETFKVCSENDDLMIIQKRRAKASHTKKMKSLFERVNSDGDESLSEEEFKLVMQDEWVHTWLSAMDVDVSNIDRLWNLLDNGDGQLTADELVQGVARLKGSAKSVDMLAHMQEMEALVSRVADIHEIVKSVDEIRDTLAEVVQSLVKSNACNYQVAI